MEWRLKSLSQMGGLTDKVINLISRSSGYSKRAIYDLIDKDGIIVTKQFNHQLASILKSHFMVFQLNLVQLCIAMLHKRLEV